MLKFQPSSTTEMLFTFVFHTSLNLYFFFLKLFSESKNRVTLAGLLLDTKMLPTLTYNTGTVHTSTVQYGSH